MRARIRLYSILYRVRPIRRLFRHGRGAVLLGVLLAAWLYWVWEVHGTRRDVMRLPTAERAETYRRELQSFKELCGRVPAAGSLNKQCRDRAEFLLQFPECDSACQALTRAYLSKPTR